jgi:putative radical SAM enzyme (TIGR03279 family)
LVEIAEVVPGSIAQRRGLAPGDRLMSINGREVRDSIDYQFLASEERLSLKVRKPDGTVRSLRIVKEPDDTLGIQLNPFTIRQCRNKCIFCFVDQMPPGCRRSLYVRDDDYRASFLYGNYITLSNLREDDWERIFTQRLSPLYVSVHATEPGLRTSIMRGRNSVDILAALNRLAAGGIRIHTQIVLCPGINDGPHLERTINDLAALFPAMQSIAVVPVGKTLFRKGLYPLRTFSRREARSVIGAVRSFADRYKRTYGTRLVFASDEFFIKAGLDVPALADYEELAQIENGVGMVAQFLHDAHRTRMPSQVSPIRLTMVTGASFGPILKKTVQKLEQIKGVSVRIITAENTLFGASVTVAGLLAGHDILKAVKGKRLGDLLLIPAAAVKEDEGIFLDDMTINDLETAAGIPVHPVSTFSDAVRLLRKTGKKPRPGRNA